MDHLWARTDEVCKTATAIGFPKRRPDRQTEGVGRSAACVGILKQGTAGKPLLPLPTSNILRPCRIFPTSPLPEERSSLRKSYGHFPPFCSMTLSRQAD